MAGASSRSHYFLHTGRKVQEQTYKREALTLDTVCARLLAVISTPTPERWQHGSRCPYSQDSMLTARLWASRHLSSVTSTSRWSPVRPEEGVLACGVNKLTATWSVSLEQTPRHRLPPRNA